MDHKKKKNPYTSYENKLYFKCIRNTVVLYIKQYHTMHYKVHSNKHFLAFTVKDIVTKIHHHPTKLCVVFAVL